MFQRASLLYHNASGCKPQKSQLTFLNNIFMSLTQHDQKRQASRVNSATQQVISNPSTIHLIELP